ncbi:MAG: hypothetical protein IJX37_00850, partial [Oscillospiraceae bacterium]|nr:hypothetical protein [Oscillospiraceae bacterium]
MQIFNLDISQKGIPPVLLVKQIDVGRKFKVIITDGGAAYTVPEDAVFSVWYAGSSGSGNYSTIDDRPAVVVDGNVATVEIIAQMITNSGGGNLCLVLNAVDGSQIGLWNITYIVEAVPGMGSKAAEEYYTAFSKAASDLALAAKTFTPDKTLTKPDSPAEAAATGQAIAVERARINELAAMRGENGELTFSYDEGGVIFSIISNGAYAIISGKLSNFSKQAGEVKVKIPNTFKPFNGDVLLYDEHITISVVAEEAEPYDAYFRIYSASQISVNEICFSEEYHTKDA